MKNFLTLVLFGAAASSAYALPSLSLDPTTGLVVGNNSITIKYTQDTAPPLGVGYSAKIKLTLPTGATMSNVVADRASVCQADTASPADTIAVANARATAIPASHDIACTFDLVIPAGVTSINYEFQNVIQTVEPAVDNTVPNYSGNLAVGGGGGFNTTVNYSVGAGTGTGTFACDSGATGATVAGGTTVSCTATPNGTDTSAITGCPTTATTNTNTSCVFNAITTGDDEVNLVATFTAAGTGPGTNPARPGDARPVPALGVFGLLAMLASMFGAATLVLRRKR